MILNTLGLNGPGVFACPHFAGFCWDRSQHLTQGNPVKIGYGHRVVKLFGKRLPWHYCKRCGIILLKNSATDRVIRKMCDAELDD
jgi:hypothetical protein